ncbi:transposase [Vibrio parahaemolyticus]|nr:transposase [Vibrio parahaemolyticus]MBE4194901.1 transposase [Vibrio parahaemolyticus]
MSSNGDVYWVPAGLLSELVDGKVAAHVHVGSNANGICERFHKTILNELYQVTFRKKLYGSMEVLQKDLGEWMEYYNNHRTHQGKMCCGRTPIETLEDGKSIWAERNLAQI